MTLDEYLMGHPEDILNPRQMYLHDLEEDEERDRLQAGVSSLILDAEDLLDEEELESLLNEAGRKLEMY